jgi:hypothetical protein
VDTSLGWAFADRSSFQLYIGCRVCSRLESSIILLGDTLDVHFAVGGTGVDDWSTSHGISGVCESFTLLAFIVHYARSKMIAFLYRIVKLNS